MPSRKFLLETPTDDDIVSLVLYCYLAPRTLSRPVIPVAIYQCKSQEPSVENSFAGMMFKLLGNATFGFGPNNTPLFLFPDCVTGVLFTNLDVHVPPGTSKFPAFRCSVCTVAN